MAELPVVFIIILNWNGWRDTIACVESCQRLVGENFHIVVVDNGSTDGSEAKLRERFPELEIIQSGANLGFAGGNNVGIRRALAAGADYVWLLNNDTEVAPDALSALVEALELAPGVGMASSKIYFHNDPKRLCFAGGLWEKGRLRLRMLGAGQLDAGQFDDACERWSISGCSMFVRSRTILDIGLMEESYFLYWEDTEWCARARKKGYGILFVPKSHVWHKVSASVGENSWIQHYYFNRSGCYFLRQHDRRLLPLFAANNFLFCGSSLVKGKSQPFKGFIYGIYDFLRGVTGPMKPR